jgi:undecaprenyl-diphosphatase
MVSIIEALIAGTLQGLLEWLPVSSEGNLVILLGGFLGLEAGETLRLAVFLHIGTGLAALIYYRKDVKNIILTKTPADRILLYRLILITFLTGFIGFPIYLYLSISIILGESLLALTGLALIVTGLMQRKSRLNGYKEVYELDWQETIFLGIVQGLAIIPGLSRSGITTSLLLFRNYRVTEAFRISFLMSIPSSFAAGFGMMIIESYALSLEATLSLLTSLIVGYFTIHTLLKTAKKTSFWKICLGLGVIAFLAFIPSLVSHLVG